MDERVTQLMNTMPSINPDGYAAGQEGDCGNIACGGWAGTKQTRGTSTGTPLTRSGMAVNLVRGRHLLLYTPGIFTLQVYALDFVTSNVEVTDKHEAIVLDFTLSREVKSSGLTKTGKRK